MAKHISRDGVFQGIHAEKNHDIDAEFGGQRAPNNGFDIDAAPNGDPHMALGNGDGPATLLALHPGAGVGIVGDWTSDGADAVGGGDYDSDGDVDGADYLI